MTIEPATQFRDHTGANRLVWVLNRNPEPYKEMFRGSEISVPGNLQKIPKNIRDGGSLMPFLEARKFLGQPRAAATKKTDGTLTFPPKALKTVELTSTELDSLLKKDQPDPIHQCTLCPDGKVFKTASALKTHMGREHE